MSTKNTGTIWWAGYATGMSIALIFLGNPAGTGRNSPWVTIPAAIAVIWYANRRSLRAEKQLRANTVELIEPSPGYLRWKRRSR
jgi:hypothetical protein